MKGEDIFRAAFGLPILVLWVRMIVEIVLA